MKKIVLWVVLLLFVLCGCTANNVFDDHFDSPELTKEIAKIIVHSYNSTLPSSQDFSETEQIAYERAFRYFSYFGFYDKDGQFRENLNKYLVGNEYRLPAEMVDTYLLSKFNTQVDHGAIAIYDAQTDRYIVRPDEAYKGEITIDSVTALAEHKYQIVATVKEDPQSTLFATLQTFTVEYDGDFKFLSFQSQQKSFQKLSQEEQTIISYIDNYYLFDPSLQFNAEHKLTYVQVFPYFAIFGFWNENGDVRQDLGAYATAGLYDAYHIPATIVDDFLCARFDVTLDRSLIDCYNAQNGYYEITPQVADRHDFAQLLDYEQDGNIYTVTVKQRNWLDPKYEQTQHFRLELDGQICKYLAFEIK